MEFGIDQSSIYRECNLNFTFEFKSPVRRRDMASKLSKNTGRKVKWFKGVNEDFKPNKEIFKLSNKYSKNSKTFIFETGMIPYHEGMRLMLQTMNIIDHFGWTNDRCELKVGISMNESKLDLPVGITSINRFKYLIGLDESKILKTWNTDKTDRIKVPHNKYFYFHSKNPYDTIVSSSLIERADSSRFNFTDSEFFGQSFKNLSKGIIEISYIGGKDYQKRKIEAKDTINSVIYRIHETLKDNFKYTTAEKRSLDTLISEYNRAVDSTRNFMNLRSNYPNIKMLYDLKPQEYLIESNYNSMREKIFDLLVFGGVHIGDLNWDNDRKMFQVKDAKIDKNVMIEGVEFYNCEIEADAKNCLFQSCIIRNSKLQECDIISSNFIKNSKVLECKYHGSGNTVSRSYIDNRPEDMIDATLRDCLVNRGTFKLNSQVDKKTKFLNGK